MQSPRDRDGLTYCENEGTGLFADTEEALAKLEDLIEMLAEECPPDRWDWGTIPGRLRALSKRNHTLFITKIRRHKDG